MVHYLPEVTVKYIEWLIEQAQNGSHDDTWRQERIIELRCIVRQQQNKLHVFFLTVDALQEQYQEKYERHDQLSRRLTQELSEKDATFVAENEQQTSYDEQLLHFLEQQLYYWRTHVTQQRNKKTKREQQYHQIYFLPVVNTHYQRKYIQARDKTNQVEQQLSDLHHAMDFVKTRLKQHRQDLTAQLKYRQALVERQQQIGTEMDKWQRWMLDLKQAQSFWSQFDTQHIQPYLDILLRCGDWEEKEEEEDYEWNRLRQMTLDYERAQKRDLLSNEDWDDISFSCTRCYETIHHHWPRLDKQTTQLLCTPCHQHAQAQRIVKEIPLPILPPRPMTSSITIMQPQGKQQSSSLPPPLPPRPSSSTSSMPSLFSSTTKSVHDLLKDCTKKPIVKKMKSTLAKNIKLDLLAHHPVFVSKYLYRSLLP